MAAGELTIDLAEIYHVHDRAEGEPICTTCENMRLREQAQNAARAQGIPSVPPPHPPAMPKSPPIPTPPPQEQPIGSSTPSTPLQPPTIYRCDPVPEPSGRPVITTSFVVIEPLSDVKEEKAVDITLSFGQHLEYDDCIEGGGTCTIRMLKVRDSNVGTVAGAPVEDASGGSNAGILLPAPHVRVNARVLEEPLSHLTMRTWIRFLCSSMTASARVELPKW